MSVELSGVVKHYPVGSGDPIRAVDGVSLTVAGGEFVALYGPSGSGKTTLLELIASFLLPDAGSVTVNGTDVASLSPDGKAHYLRREVGLISQSFALMATSALTNATLKLHADGVSLREARKRARPWLERVGLGERLNHRPEQLSMGERQRVAIARALACEPTVLLADEPTGNLDSERTGEVLALLRDVCHERGIPALIVTHDDAASDFVERVHTLRDGRLLDGGRIDATIASSP